MIIHAILLSLLATIATTETLATENYDITIPLSNTFHKILHFDRKLIRRRSINDSKPSDDLSSAEFFHRVGSGRNITIHDIKLTFHTLHPQAIQCEFSDSIKIIFAEMYVNPSGFVRFTEDDEKFFYTYINNMTVTVTKYQNFTENIDIDIKHDDIKIKPLLSLNRTEELEIHDKIVSGIISLLRQRLRYHVDTTYFDVFDFCMQPKSDVVLAHPTFLNHELQYYYEISDKSTPFSSLFTPKYNLTIGGLTNFRLLNVQFQPHIHSRSEIDNVRGHISLESSGTNTELDFIIDTVILTSNSRTGEVTVTLRNHRLVPSLHHLTRLDQDWITEKIETLMTTSIQQAGKGRTDTTSSASFQGAVTTTIPFEKADTTHSQIADTTRTVPCEDADTTDTVPSQNADTTHSLIADTTDTVPSEDADTTDTVPSEDADTTETVPLEVADYAETVPSEDANAAGLPIAPVEVESNYTEYS